MAWSPHTRNSARAAGHRPHTGTVGTQSGCAGAVQGQPRKGQPEGLTPKASSWRRWGMQGGGVRRGGVRGGRVAVARRGQAGQAWWAVRLRLSLAISGQGTKRVSPVVDGRRVGLTWQRGVVAGSDACGCCSSVAGSTTGNSERPAVEVCAGSVWLALGRGLARNRPRMPASVAGARRSPGSGSAAGPGLRTVTSVRPR